MQKKYEMTNETKTIKGGIVLHRIRALRNIALANGTEVKTGDKGGFVASEDNLSHDGNAWVGDDACVFGNARVSENAYIYENARVGDNAHVACKAEVRGYANIFGNARIRGSAKIYDNGEVFRNAHVYDNSRVCGQACVCGNASICGNAWVGERAMIYGNAWLRGNARIYGSADVHDNALISDDAEVFDEADVGGHAEICGNTRIRDIRDFTVYKNTWSSSRWFTYTHSNKMWSVGCFYGTGDELIAKAYNDSKMSGKCYEAIVRAQEAIVKETEH